MYLIKDTFADLCRKVTKRARLTRILCAISLIYILISFQSQFLNSKQTNDLNNSIHTQSESIRDERDRELSEFLPGTEMNVTHYVKTSPAKIPESVTTKELATLSMTTTQPAPTNNISLKPLHVQRQFEVPIHCQSMVDNKDPEQLMKADGLTQFYREYRDNKLQDQSNSMKVYLEDLKLIPDENFIIDESRCDEFINTRGYYNYTVTDKEKAFPLAYSFRTYEQAEQFERLLRAVYRPQNVYCVHIDAKSNAKFHEAIKSIVRCFPNVFVATKLERVYWGSFPLLMADLNCLKDLTMPPLENKQSYHQQTQESIEKFWSHENLKNKKIPCDWKYLFNMASTDFPLRTNRELVQILTIFNGTNDIMMSVPFPEEFRDRYQTQWIFNETTSKLKKTDIPKSPPPHNLTLVKASQVAKDLLDWLKDTFLSDESFFGTMQYNIQFKPPGSFKKMRSSGHLGHLTRFMGWAGGYECDKAGYRRNGICMLTNGDLKYITNLSDFFANKFQLIDDPVAFACMEDWYARRHQRENDLSKNGTHFVLDLKPYCRYLHHMSSGEVYKGCEKFLK